MTLSEPQFRIMETLLKRRHRTLSVYPSSTGATVFRCDNHCGPVYGEADGRSVRGLYRRGFLGPIRPGLAALPPEAPAGFYRPSRAGRAAYRTARGA